MVALQGPYLCCEQHARGQNIFASISVPNPSLSPWPVPNSSWRQSACASECSLAIGTSTMVHCGAPPSSQASLALRAKSRRHFFPSFADKAFLFTPLTPLTSLTQSRPILGAAVHAEAFTHPPPASETDSIPWVQNSLYSLLGLPHTVETSEIKLAYRQLARRYHPDVCQGGHSLSPEECTRRFIEVHEAYETLSDPMKRAMYDYELMHPRRRQRQEGLRQRRPWQRQKRPWEGQAQWSSMEEQAEAMRSWRGQVASQLNGLRSRSSPKPGSWAAHMAHAQRPGNQ